ncbi:hypothetical protein [Rhodococcus koreensis]
MRRLAGHEPLMSMSHICTARTTFATNRQAAAAPDSVVEKLVRFNTRSAGTIRGIARELTALADAMDHGDADQLLALVGGSSLAARLLDEHGDRLKRIATALRDMAGVAEHQAVSASVDRVDGKTPPAPAPPDPDPPQPMRIPRPLPPSQPGWTQR